MSGDHPLRWIGAAAVVVGFFAVFASSGAGESPRALDLKVAAYEVSYAPTHNEAVAKTSQPVTAPRLASRVSQARKATARIGTTPFAPAVPLMTIAQAQTIAATSSLSQTDGGMTRALKAHHRAAHVAALPRLVRNAIAHVDHCTVPPITVALITARPLRGPPV